MSSASTAATESSKSTIVVMADSRTTSATPAGSVCPTWVDGSMHDLDAQAVMGQQDAARRRAVAPVAREACRVGELDPAPSGQRDDEPTVGHR